MWERFRWLLYLLVCVVYILLTIVFLVQQECTNSENTLFLWHDCVRFDVTYLPQVCAISQRCWSSATRLTSILCRSSEILSKLRSSWRVCSFFHVSSPWALKALIIALYASTSGREDQTKLSNSCSGWDALPSCRSSANPARRRFFCGERFCVLSEQRHGQKKKRWPLHHCTFSFHV